MAPTPLETAAASAALAMSPVQENARWSKEEIFGLLSVIFVVLVPCLGFALRCLIVKYWSGKRRERRLPGMKHRHYSSQRRADLATAGNNRKSPSIGSGRRNQLRLKGVRNNTVVLVL
jgi:hypothetical protein